MTMFIKEIYNNYIKPKSEDEDLRRKEFITNILLIASILLLLLSNIISIINLIFVDPVEHSNNAISFYIVLFILLFFIGLYVLSRRGYFKVSAYIFLTLYFLLSAYMMIVWGIGLHAAMLFCVLLIIMSGVLISTRAAFYTSLILSVSIFFINYLHTNGIVEPNLYWRTIKWDNKDIIVISIIFFILATISWLSNRETNKALNRARMSETKLKEEKDLLEVRVAVRTDELQKAQMEKMNQLSRFAEFGRLTSGLFHDLVNPLTAISLNIENIKKNQNHEYDMYEMSASVDKSIKATRRMQKFINSVRKQISFQETNETFSLNNEIEEAIDMLEQRIQNTGIDIIFEADEPLQTYGNPIKFNQVVTNLISNAIDAFDKIPLNEIKRERNVQVKLSSIGNNIALQISDNGCGIKEEMYDKIFEPFFSTKIFNHGTGIGLSITKSIIEKDFNGKIELDKINKDKTTFRVVFPQRQSINKI